MGTMSLKDNGIEYEINNYCGRNIKTAGNSNFTLIETILNIFIRTKKSYIMCFKILQRNNKIGINIFIHWQ